MNDCRKEGANRVLIKHGDVYPCNVCSKVNHSLQYFKEHVFYKHQEDQM